MLVGPAVGVDVGEELIARPAAVDQAPGARRLPEDRPEGLANARGVEQAVETAKQASATAPGTGEVVDIQA